MRLPHLLIASAALIGCAACSSADDDGGFLVAAPTSTPTAEIPVATATATVAPAPTTEATPTPVETPAQAPSLQVNTTWIAPGSVVEVTINDANAAGTATLLERDFRLSAVNGHTWGLVGVGPDAALGGANLHVELESGLLFDQYVEVIDAGYPIDYITLTETSSGLLTPDNAAYERERVAEARAHFEPEAYWEGSFIYPLHTYITAEYGDARSYNGGPVSSWHRGVDFGAPEGYPIRAANSGVVVLAEELPLSGNCVFIHHGFGIFSQYSHQSRLLVVEGQRVEKGDIIGEVGATGIVTGAHLHWSMYVGDVAVNPHQWTWQTMRLP